MSVVLPMPVCVIAARLSSAPIWSMVARFEAPSVVTFASFAPNAGPDAKAASMAALHNAAFPYRIIASCPGENPGRLPPPRRGLLMNGSEDYIDGAWDTDDVETLIAFFLPAYLQNCRQNGIAMLDALNR